MFRFVWISLVLCLWHGQLQAATEDELWQQLSQGGYVVLMRHSLAPGVGDPSDFDINDCSTQRNLSQRGRDQSTQLGEQFAERNVPVTEALSSAWCRCQETAKLAFGEYQVWDALNSFFRDRSTEPQQTEAVKARLQQIPADGGNLVLVTHQVNITAATDYFPNSGEMLVIKPLPPNSFELVGTIKTLSN